MHDDFSRMIAFFTVVLALLCAGLHFHLGHIFPTIYFMVGAVLLTAVTHLNVRKRLI